LAWSLLELFRKPKETLMFGLIRSGMATAMHELSVVSNNIANAGSTAFKKSDVSFSDLYSSSSPYSVSRTAVGQGSNVYLTRMSDAQGGIMDRGGALNLAIVGSGYFTVSPPDASGGPSGGLYFSRNGEFSIDKDGFIRAADQSFIMGMPAVDGIIPSTVAASSLTRIAVPFSIVKDDLPVPMSNLEIGNDGSVSATYGPDDVRQIGRIGMAIFPNQSGLKNMGGGTFSQTKDSGDAILGSAGDIGYGTLQSGAVETSNVDITKEMTVMMRSQQQFNGAARLLQTNADMVEKLTR
jgi:flagellar hook protein FlgE